MKPVLAVIAATAIAVGSSALPAAARLVDDGSVVSLSVVPATGKADVVVGVAGGVQVSDSTLRGPDRIVLDLAGASLGMAARAYDRVDRAGITDVKFSQFRRGTVRVVIYLDAPHGYQVSRSDNNVRVSVTVPITSQFAAWHTGSSNAESKTQHADDGGAAAGEPATPPERAVPDQVREPRVVVRNVAAAEPVGMVPMGRVIERPSNAVQQRTQQAPITVTYQDSPIIDVIAAFAAYSGRTIIPSSAVPGGLRVNAEIKNQPWDVALKAILSSLGLAATEEASGIIIVDTQERIAARTVTEPLRTQIVRLNYQRATPVAEQVRQRLLQCIPSEVSRSTSSLATGQQTALPNSGPPPAQAAAPGQMGTNGNVNTATSASATTSCVGRGTVTFDETTNSISITAPASQLEELTSFAQLLDVRQPQVSVKAKIVLVNRTDLDALGIKYDLGSPQQFFNSVIQRVDSTGTPLTPTSPPTVLLGGNTVSAIANASGTIPGAALRLIYSTALGNFDFTTFLDALQEVNLLDVQSEPSATIINNKTADLTSGVQVPFVPLVSSGGAGTTLTGPVTVERVQTGVHLLVTPSVTNNRQIVMTVEVSNSDVNFTNNGTLIDNNSVKNTVIAADGQTIVIGGLTQTSVRVTKSGIPLLVDLPFLGRLFGFTTRQEQRRDLLILLTSHIIDEGQSPADTVRR